MDFEWDETKRAGNLAKHGLDFADVAKLDWENATILRDDRFRYGEPRFWAFALMKWTALHGCFRTARKGFSHRQFSQG